MEECLCYKIMKISEFKNIIQSLKYIVFELPGGKRVPPHFHITEIGIIRKTYIDCGGDLRVENLINMQLWYSNDINHKIEPTKILKIIQNSEKLLKFQDEEIQIEYQQDTICKFNLEFKGDSTFKLIKTFTDCIDKESCNIIEKPRIRIKKNQTKCDPTSGCC